jgi:hypothetical protein
VKLFENSISIYNLFVNAVIAGLASWTINFEFCDGGQLSFAIQLFSGVISRM